MAVAWQTKSSSSVANGTSLTISVPSGTVNGDLLLLVVSCSSNVHVTDPTGWTVLNKHGTCTTGSTCTGQNVYFRQANSEPASYTLTIDSANVWSSTMWRINGQDATNPIDSWSVADGTGTSWVAPSINTAAANCMLCWFGTTANTAITSFTVPTGFTERTPITDNINCMDGSTKAFVGPGATGTVTGTPGTGSTSSDRWVAHLIAVAPTGSSVEPLHGASQDGVPVLGKINRRVFRHDFSGWSRFPLPADLAGAAPVTNYLDIPTVDRRHSQVAFHGFSLDGVHIDNSPSFNMPLPSTDLPALRTRRGHDFSGLQSGTLKFEYDMAGQSLELPPMDRRRRFDYSGLARPQYFLDAPPESYGKVQWTIPPQDRRGQARPFQALYQGAKNSPAAADVIPVFTTSFLPLLGVGNGNGVVPPSPLSAIVVQRGPDFQPRYSRLHSYQGMQSQRALLAADDPPYPIQSSTRNTELPVRKWRLPDYSCLWWKVGDSQMAPPVWTDLPGAYFKRKQPVADFQAGVGALLPMDQVSQQTELPVRRRRGIY